MARTDYDEPVNGYRNWATFHTSLMLDNERGVYDAMRRIMHETRRADLAAPELKKLVNSTLAGHNQLLRADERRVWRKEIRDAGGLERVDWLQLAESEMEGILPVDSWGLSRSRPGANRRSHRLGRRLGPVLRIGRRR